MSFNLLKPKYKRKRLRWMNYTLLSVLKCASNINISRWLTIYNKDYLWNTVRSSSHLQLWTNTIYCFNLSCSCKCGILYPNTGSAGREKVNEPLLLAQDYKVHRKRVAVHKQKPSWLAWSPLIHDMPIQPLPPPHFLEFDCYFVFCLHFPNDCLHRCAPCTSAFKAAFTKNSHSMYPCIYLAD